MLLLSGRLHKQAHHEANQARLLCDWGTFTVFDASVKGIESDEHPVMFEFRHITMKSKITGQGQSMTYLVANLKQLVFHDSGQKPVKQSTLRLVDTACATETQTELPFEHQEESATREDIDPPEDSQADTSPSAVIPFREDTEEAALFGELWPLGEVVKLDPSVGRARYRQQKEVLVQRDYQYSPECQEWWSKDALEKSPNAI